MDSADRGLMGPSEWTSLPPKRRRRLAGRRDRPRDAAEAAALRGYAEHLRSRSGVLESALYGAGGAIVGGLVLGLLTGGAAPGIVYVVVFLIVWTSTGVLIRRRQARRLHALADRDSSPP